MVDLIVDPRAVSHNGHYRQLLSVFSFGETQRLLSVSELLYAAALHPSAHYQCDSSACLQLKPFNIIHSW